MNEPIRSPTLEGGNLAALVAVFGAFSLVYLAVFTLPSRAFAREGDAVASEFVPPLRTA